MKRSQINSLIENAMDFWGGLGFKLPPYARWGIEEWQTHADECKEIFDLQIGWDVTSFGTEDFFQTGLLLYTLRNGKLNSTEYPKPYAEKIMMVRENQITPRHFHWSKREDIINRGGGNLVIELYKADPAKNAICGGSFPVSINSMTKILNTGNKVILTPGDSITMEHFHCHKFYGEPGSGPSMIGEVSMVNDDETDNCFVDGANRFVPATEDEAIRYPLACEYRTLIQAKQA